MTATVRAKFDCQSITHSKGSRHAADATFDKNRGWDKYEECICSTLVLAPVYTGHDGENAKFWEATPSGRLEMQVINQPAAEMFKVGKSYYLDFTPAD